MFKIKNRTWIKASLVSILLLVSGCATTSGDLVENGHVTIDIQRSSISYIHKVVVLKKDEGVLIRGHVNYHQRRLKKLFRLCGAPHNLNYEKPSDMWSSRQQHCSCCRI
jgi:hypothetical protein